MPYIIVTIYKTSGMSICRRRPLPDVAGPRGDAKVERQKSDKIWVGIDIGNTKSEYVACDETGTVVSFAVGPGANHQAVGYTEALNTLRESYSTLLPNGRTPDFVFVGAAGADTQNDFDILHALFSEVFGSAPFAFENDGLVALKNGLDDQRGLVVTCGTSNTNFAVDNGGRIERIGGLTDHLGDKLGAYAIARAAMSAATRGEDRREAPTVLTRLLTSEFGVSSMGDLISVPLDSQSVRRVIECLFEATRMGDGRSLALTWDFVEEIIRIIDLFASSMFFDGDPFRVVLDGPVYRAGYAEFLTMIRLAVAERYPAEIVIPETPPVLGAVFLAFEHSGIQLTPQQFSRARESFTSRSMVI
jgi:N-acetylglucosamine kinase-like BadF-type ATPase